MDLNEDFKSVYVYSDFVSPRPVGDTMAPLLRIVPMSEKKKELVYRLYEKPLYVPLSRLPFNTTEILLTTDKGQPISFSSGSTIVTLHFRRKRPDHYYNYKMIHHTPYAATSKIYYCSQAGHGLLVFIGGRNIRGRGLGSLLGGIGRSLIPLLKSGGKALLKEGARTRMQVAQDVLSGQNVKSALTQGAKQAGKRLFLQVVGHVTGRAAPPGQPAKKAYKIRTTHKRSTSKRRRQPAKHLWLDQSIMALVHPKSYESVHTGLNLFSVPPTQTAVEEGQFVEFHPLSSLSPGAPIEFAISGATSEYLDLSNTYLHVCAKITKADGTILNADTDVAPVNNWLHSLFSQVDISLDDTLVTPIENTYPLRAYIETTLNFGGEAKKSHLTSALYYRDSSDHMDDTQGDDNLGLKARRTLSARSRELDMMGRLHSDIMHQERYLINGVDVKIRLIPSKVPFI